MPPPLQEQHQVSHGSESLDWPDTDGTDQGVDYDPWTFIEKLFPSTHHDPSGRKVLRELQKSIGYVEPDAEIFLRIKSKHRGNIDVRVDFEMKSMLVELLERAAEITQTQSGERYRARIKKNTPEMHVAKQSHHGGPNN